MNAISKKTLTAALALAAALALFGCKEEKAAAAAAAEPAAQAEGTAAEEAIDFGKLQKKGDVYYLNDKPFTGKAVNMPGNIIISGYFHMEMKDGRFHGKFEGGEGGPWIVGNYKDGKKDGEWRYTDGPLLEIQNYKDDKKHGEWMYFNEDVNKLTKTEVWENDKLISATEEKFETNNLCRDNENVLVSFKMKNSSKLMSLCVEKSENYIAYRYGTKDSVELEYPENKTGSWEKFIHYHEYYSGGSDFMLSFQNGSFTYEIQDQHFKGGERELGINVINSKTGNATALNGDAKNSEGALGNVNNYDKLKDGGSLLAHQGVEG